MGVALVGLIGFQLYWIDTVVKSNEERFTKDVMQAMNNVALKLEKQETVEAFRRFRSVDALRPQFRRQPNYTNQFQSPIQRGAINNVGRTTSRANPIGQQRETIFNQQLPQHEQIIISDTLHGQGFQIFFNYELTNFPPSGLGQNWPSQDNPSISTELQEKQSEIEQLEDQLDWLSRKYELTTNVLDDLLTPGKALSNRFDPKQLDSLLQLELHDKGIFLNYDYGVISPRLGQFVALNNPSQNEVLARSDLRASLFPNDLMGNGAYLVLDFPGKSRYLLEKIWVTMVSSGILVLVILLCFGYSIRTIIRQKKLSLMKNDFINNMTHEFKTPIATVSLATEALQDRALAQSEDMRTRYVKMIQDENRRLGSQVERVLQIAAIDKQDFNLNKEELNLHEIITSLIENMKIQVDNKGGRITSILGASSFEILGDETHITNCILNLLDNANKYSPEAPNIIVRTENSHGTVSISVSDHGMGMSKETQKHVFEKFYRLPTGNRHDVKGFGLGLSYVKSMVEAHEGNVAVDSTLGKGSKFTITLPLN